MPERSHTLADGRLAAASATVIAGSSVPDNYVTVILSNTGTAEETVILTFTRAGGTARRLRRLVLQENEQAEIRNIPIQPDDTLSGYTTTASVVDYLVNKASGGGFSAEIYDAYGTSKGVTTMTANKWTALAATPAGAAASIGLGVVAEVKGGIIIRPGFTLGLNAVVGTATGTSLIGCSWHEATLPITA